MRPFRFLEEDPSCPGRGKARRTVGGTSSQDM
jgi:hypothetical protein